MGGDLDSEKKEVDEEDEERTGGGDGVHEVDGQVEEALREDQPIHYQQQVSLDHAHYRLRWYFGVVALEMGA